MNKSAKNLIYLTGFMGSGKSTIGPILANTLGFSFIDIDKEIIRKTGKPITEIFSESGEQYFRDVEHSLILEASTQVQTVVALGGGSVAFERNMSIIKSTGTLVYLMADQGQLLKRLRRKTDRPLLHQTDENLREEAELRSSIKSLADEREKFYLQADIAISTAGKSVGITVDELVRALKSHVKLAR